MNKIKLHELLKKFENGQELYKNDSTFNHIINAIMRDEINSYKAIELLIEMINKQSELITSYIQIQNS